MDVLEAFSQLVDDVLLMEFVEEVLFDGVEEVALHVLEEQVEVHVVGGFYYLAQFYDVLVGG